MNFSSQIFHNSQPPELPEWVKVKLAAVGGFTATVLPSFLETVGPMLDVLIKVGQAGVALVTIGYIHAKWRNARRNKSDE